MNRKKSSIWEGVSCLVVIVFLFGGIGSAMGVSQMLNTLMKTAHDLLLNTVRLFERDEAVLDQYQRRFRYIMVDEYNDHSFKLCDSSYE